MFDWLLNLFRLLWSSWSESVPEFEVSLDVAQQIMEILWAQDDQRMSADFIGVKMSIQQMKEVEAGRRVAVEDVDLQPTLDWMVKQGMLRVIDMSVARTRLRQKETLGLGPLDGHLPGDDYEAIVSRDEFREKMSCLLK